jgi:hypothetical protein
MILGVTLSQVVALTSVATLLVAAGAIYFSLRAVRHQLWLQTFTEFTRRYSDLAVELPGAARDPAEQRSLAQFESEDQTRLLRFGRGYFNLCSEEHFLRSRKRIDEETWQIWCHGIDDMLRLAWLRDLWSELKHEYECYEPFHDFMSERVVARNKLEG